MSTPARSLRPTLEVTENSVAAHHDAKAGEQLVRHLAARQDISDGVGLMRKGRGKSGQALGEDCAIAGRRLASPLPKSSVTSCVPTSVRCTSSLFLKSTPKFSNGELPKIKAYSQLTASVTGFQLRGNMK